MGIIRKQTVSGSFFSYAGVILGFVNLAILMPEIFSPDQIGLPALIISVSIIASQIGSLGFNGVTIRLFPYFRNYENNHNGFLGLTILVQSIGLIIVVCGMIFFIPHLIERNSDDLEILSNFAFLIIPVLIFQLYFVLFDSFCRVLYNAAIGIILKEFVLRILNLIIILLFWFEIVTFKQYMFLYVISYAVPAIVLIVYLISKNEIKFNLNLGFIKKPFRKELITVSFYGIIAGLSGIAVISIDRYMINDIMNLSSVGIYSVAFAFGTLILIPGRAMAKIAAPLIADMWKEGEIGKIKEVYTKSSINQFLGGLALLLIIWINIDDILALLRPDYLDGKFVILFIALANLITAISGISTQVLSTSGSFRYHTWFMLMMIVLIVVSNLIFIPMWGITGAAVATFVSTLIYSFARILFLGINYKMYPFRLSHLVSVAIVVFVYFTVRFLNLELLPLYNIILKASISGTLFLLLVYLLRCSPDFNDTLKDLIGRFLKRDRS
ncbi:MAG: polysaccharide biosynthesis C-terminal domain-containing protein [Bacteroidales bacterium]|nr:polysaccharide biosynthesis C-terminal domain-containing protein [Bacteroidales bacterium]